MIMLSERLDFFDYVKRRLEMCPDRCILYLFLESRSSQLLVHFAPWRIVVVGPSSISRRPNSAVGRDFGLQVGPTQKAYIKIGTAQVLAQTIARWQELGCPKMLLADIEIEQGGDDLLYPLS